MMLEISDQYRVRRELASGGMATVYVADDLKHGRRVAIKVFRPELTGTLGAERFLREIQAAATLQHPHILPLFDSGRADGLLYYVMPYIEGETLRERMARAGQLSAGEALRIAGEVADALAYAHGQGLVHRDIKPENIMLFAGHAIVMDFGICRALNETGGEALTRSGITIGTPAYMSPEQWSSPEKVGARSDIYSLGCVLYEMLAGEPPFSGSTPQALLAKHTQQVVPSLRVLRPDVPPELDETIRNALAKVPEERLATAAELGARLNALGSDTRPALTSGAGLALPQAGAADTGPQRTVPSPGGTRGFARNARTYLAAAAILTALAAGVLILVRNGDPAASPVQSALEPRRVVVGILENRTGNPEHDELGFMAADWIAEGLHRTGAVDVVPSPDALQATEFVRRSIAAGDRGSPNQLLAEETGAGIVVSGAYYEIEDSLQFQLQITNAATGSLLSALEPVHSLPGAAGSAIQLLRNRLMGALAIALDERLSIPATAERPPDYEAYRAFSQGVERYVRNENAAAVEHLLEAFALDTTFLVPLLYASFSYSNMQQFARADSMIELVRSRESELSNYDRHWFEYVDRQLRADREGALRAIRRAAEAAPGSKAGYNRAYAAQLANRPAEAVEALEGLDPERGPMRGWFPYWEILTDAYHRLGEHQKELDSARQAAALFPEHDGTVRMRAEALAALGATRQLEQLLDSLTLHPGATHAGAVLTHAAAELRMHGDAALADRTLERALAWYAGRPEQEKQTEGHRAQLATVLHEALRWSEARPLLDQLAEEFPGNPAYRAWRGIIAAAQNDTVVTNDVNAWLAEFDPPYSYGVYRLQRARIAAHALPDDSPAVVALYHDALEHGLPPPRHLDRNFERLWSYPPLTALLKPRS